VDNLHVVLYENKKKHTHIWFFWHIPCNSIYYSPCWTYNKHVHVKIVYPAKYIYGYTIVAFKFSSSFTTQCNARIARYCIFHDIRV
jgi:hypothetical protein